jgi:hypothetical protein
MAWIRSFAPLLVCIGTASGCLPPELTIPALGDENGNTGGAENGGTNRGMTGGGGADHAIFGDSAGGSADHAGGSTNGMGGTALTLDARTDSVVGDEPRGDASGVSQDAVDDGAVAATDGQQDAPANPADDASEGGSQVNSDASATPDAPADGPCVPSCQGPLGAKCDTTDGCGGPCTCPTGTLCVGKLCTL